MKIQTIIFASILLSYSSAAVAENSDELFRSIQNKNQFQDVIVERVISADTILVAEGKRIKLIGLKAPDAPPRPKVEYDKNNLLIEEPVLPENTLEEKAFAFAHKLLMGKHVRLEFDDTKIDEDFTTLAYVFLIKDNTLVNEEILRKGYADLRIRPTNFKYAERLREAYQEARREKRGLQGD